MKKFTTEAIVGIFVLIGLLCMAYLSITFGKIEIFGNNSYTISAEFDNISGLKKGASIEIAGVEIGRVQKILLQEEKAVVVLSLNGNIKLREDAIASIKTKGIIGDKFIKISQGGSDKFIEAGGKIRETEPPLDVEELVGKYIFGKVDNNKNDSEKKKE